MREIEITNKEGGEWKKGEKERGRSGKTKRQHN